MSFPKKKSRKINVEGNRYYWICSEGSTRNTKYNNISIISEEANNKLFARLQYNSLDSDAFFQSFSISPYIIRQIILLGINKGYDPIFNGKDIDIGEISELIILKPEEKVNILIRLVSDLYQETKFDRNYSMLNNNDEDVAKMIDQSKEYLESENWITSLKTIEKLIEDYKLKPNVKIENLLKRIYKEEKL